MKKDVKLYNMIVPLYLLMYFSPIALLITLPGNFIIDSVVLLIISLVFFKRLDKSFYIKNIWLVWILGFVADFIGVGLLFLGELFSDSYANSFREDGIYPFMKGINNISNPPFDLNFYSYIFIGIVVFVTAVVIFLFDYFISFRKSGLTKKQRTLASLAFAVFTAPYTLFLPSSLFY